jgi:hypothetical protein
LNIRRVERSTCALYILALAATAVAAWLVAQGG